MNTWLSYGIIGAGIAFLGTTVAGFISFIPQPFNLIVAYGALVWGGIELTKKIK